MCLRGIPRSVGVVGLALIVAGCEFGLPSLGTGGTGRSGPGAVRQNEPGKAPTGPVFGQILDETGKPAADATVKVFLNNTSPVALPADLVGNAGGALAAGGQDAAARFWSQSARRIAAGSTVRTDAGGYFALSLDQEGTYNLEAAKGEDFKAWKPGLQVKRGTDADAGSIRLKRAGHIRGKVKAGNPGVTDLSHTTIYIPGSSYSAITGPDGTYTISNVPEGEFHLAAFGKDLGDGRLPDRDHPAPIRVESNRTTDAPVLVLAVNQPALARLTRARLENETDNAAPGAEIDIHGEFLGHNRGTPFEVRFSAGTATQPDRLTEGLVRVKVPSDAQNGNVLVVVGGLTSNAIPLRVIRSVAFMGEPPYAQTGSTLDLAPRLEALDTAGVPIVEVRDSAGKILKARPYVSWSADSDRGVVDDRGLLTAIATGTVRVTARAGDLTPAVISVTIGPAPAPTPVPSPTPTAAPTPVPSPRELQGVVSTLAGAGLHADGTGAEVLFRQSRGIARDAAGNLYVADSGNYCIRKISPTGVVTTIAGMPGVRGDQEGRGTDARFLWPQGIVAAPDGNLYVADESALRIRKIAPDGTVSTFSGSGQAGSMDGPAGTARFECPGYFALDLSGNLFLSEPCTSGSRIRKIAQDGSVSTVAGMGEAGFADGPGDAAKFSAPGQMVLDGAGNLLVADTSNHRIRKIAPDRTVSTLTGSAGPGDQDGNLLTAQFWAPSGLAIDSGGNLLVGERWSSRIRKITPGGSVSKLAGGGNEGYADGQGPAARFMEPWNLAIDPQDSLYLVEPFGKQVRKVDPAGNVTTIAGSQWRDGPALQAHFSDLADAAVDPAGNVYVADLLNHAVRRIGPDGQVSTAAGNPAGGEAEGRGTAARFQYPQGMALDRKGNLVFSTQSPCRVWRMAPDGAVTVLAGDGGCGTRDGAGPAAQFMRPSGLAVDAAHNIFVADNGGHRIRKITPQGYVSTFAGDGTAGKVDGSGTGARFDGPYGLAFDETGNLYVSERGNHLIRKIDTAGNVTVLAGSGAPGYTDAAGAGARFNLPAYLEVGRDGNLYLADTGNHAIRKVSPQGAVTTAAGSSYGYRDGLGASAQFRSPLGMAIDALGRLIVTDQEGGRVRLIE